MLCSSFESSSLAGLAGRETSARAAAASDGARCTPSRCNPRRRPCTASTDHCRTGNADRDKWSGQSSEVVSSLADWRSQTSMPIAASSARGSGLAVGRRSASRRRSSARSSDSAARSTVSRSRRSSRSERDGWPRSGRRAGREGLRQQVAQRGVDRLDHLDQRRRPRTVGDHLVSDRPAGPGAERGRSASSSRTGACPRRRPGAPCLARASRSATQPVTVPASFMRGVGVGQHVPPQLQRRGLGGDASGQRPGDVGDLTAQRPAASR